MKETKAERTTRFYNRMMEMGFSFDEARRLRRIEKTLSRWSELECGDGNAYASWSIEREEADVYRCANKHLHAAAGACPDCGKPLYLRAKAGTPYMVTHPHQGKSYRRRIADREAGALRRLQQIVQARNQRHTHPIVQDEIVAYHQGDPRGCALYLLRKTNTDEPRSDIREGDDISSIYTRGMTVCI